MLLAIKEEMLLMGNRFEITVVVENEAEGKAHIRAAVTEIRRIEALLSTYQPASETSLINAGAGLNSVKVSEETLGLIERSIRLSKITQGAFDITYGSVDKSLWNFDLNMKSLPDAETARKMVRLIDYRKIVTNREDQTVFLKEAGMRIGFGGIGKGYAAEKAKDLLKQRGVENGIVNASGDLTVWGCQPDGSPWTIGIAHPDASEFPFSYLHLKDSAIATSGNYEKFVLIGGKKYSHTIDPRTGLPVTGIKSVTVLSPNAELCDAIATPVTIMGIEAGLHLINQLQQVECIIIDDFNKLYTSNNIKIN